MNLPVIVGVGQYTHHAESLDDALEPAVLMERAVLAAVADAGLAGVPTTDAVRVISQFSWRYTNTPLAVARRLGIEARQYDYTQVGGNTPQSLVNTTAHDIQRGDLDVAILAGGEASRSRRRAKALGIELDWPRGESDDPPRIVGEDLAMSLPDEVDRGIFRPVQVYPMFETALRAAAGRSVDDHIAHLGALWSRFSQVAAANPYAWNREAFTAEEITTPTPSNRMIGFPYTKRMVANNTVDMGAALIMCSTDAARRLGISPDRWVHVHSGTDCHEHNFVSNRDTFARTPAIELGGRLALELAGIDIDDVSVIDLYSCFPSAVQLGAQSLGLGLDRQLTRTGGLTLAGGPLNSYVMHSIAAVVEAVRAQPGEYGLVWANGGYATKHAFGVYSTTPPTEFRHARPQAEIDALPRRELASVADATGSANVEAYTVMFSRDDNPQEAFAACLLPDGRRAWGTSDDPDLAEAMCHGEWVGRAVTLSDAGTLHAD